MPVAATSAEQWSFAGAGIACTVSYVDSGESIESSISERKRGKGAMIGDGRPGCCMNHKEWGILKD
jgi:hypothetical protein